MYRLPALFCALLLAGCTNNASPERFLTKYSDPDPTPDAVTICHGYGCHRHDTVDLRLAWDRLVADMAEPAPDAATERANIARTIAAFENEVGALTGTAEDLGGTFDGFAQDGQLDCVDETSNTTTYLTLLEQAGLLVWHQVRAPMSRFFVYNGWPHTTAVIVETATGQAWAVDSWFHDNGEPAEIVPLEDWVAGWGPEPETAVASVESDAQEVAPEAEPAALPEAADEAPAATTELPAAEVTGAPADEETATVTERESEPTEPEESEPARSSGVVAMAPVISDGDPVPQDAASTEGTMSKRVIYSLGEGDDRDGFIFEVDELQYGMIVANLAREGVDLDAALEKALAMLAAIVRMNEEDVSDEVLSAQSVAVATVWFLFNEAADEEDRVEGDVVLVEKDGDIYVAELIGPDTLGNA